MATAPKLQTEQRPATLAAALVVAQRAAKAVPHDARNEHQRFNYTSAEAVMGEARSALNEAGLACIQLGWRNLTPREFEWTDDDGAIHKDSEYAVEVTFLVVHESGESLTGAVEVHVVPQKGRPLDKAQASALTMAESYYLRSLLCLPRVEKGIDMNERSDDETTDRRPARAAAPRVMANKYAADCIHCNLTVEEGKGETWKQGDKWPVIHPACKAPYKEELAARKGGAS